jgi:hypothetical protein
MKCNNCGSKISETLTYCTTCGNFIGFPNLRAASKAEEVKALENRYIQALDSAVSKSSIDIIKDFEEKLILSAAVINLSFYIVHRIILENKTLYSTYNNLVEGKARKPASIENVRKRLIVEANLFPGYAREITYAALTLDGDGLKSYGDCSIVLREIAIKDRASLLEDNSYHFIVKHDIRIEDNLPLGYRATWANRHKLAISKLEPKISFDTKPTEYSKMVLIDAGNRDRDDLLEVHIYGGFDFDAIEYVKGPSVKHPKDMLARIKFMLNKAGKKWIDQ